MTNMIQSAKDQAAARAMAAYCAAAADGTLPQAEVRTAPVEIPRDAANGDFTTTFEIRGSQVILTRTGNVNSQLVFEEGKQYTSLYETPFGELAVDIQTSRLRHSLTEQGGLMDLRYSISVDHSVAGRNAFKIRVRPALRENV